MAKIITVLDLGSNKIATASASIRKDGFFELLGLENVSVQGSSNADAASVDKTADDIAALMKKLRGKTGRKIRHVYVTTRAKDVEFLVSRGMIPLSKTPREIAKNDIKKCFALAEMAKLPLNKAVIQRHVKKVYIDDMPADSEYPVGLRGIKLEIEVFIITLGIPGIQNIAKRMDRAGFSMEGVSLSSIASAGSILEDNEKGNGALLIDIGESMTEGLVFKNNMLKAYSASKKGASAILDKDGKINAGGRNALFRFFYPALSAEKHRFSSVVVTGGGALLDGVVEEAEKVFNVPSRIGIVRNAGRSLNSQDAIIHTATLGFIEQKATEYKRDHMRQKTFLAAFRKIIDIYESYF